MIKLSIELPDELGKYVEFIPQEDLNLMFADMLQQRINGDKQPVVIMNSKPEPAFDEDKFFSKLEAMLAERTVVGTAPQPKSTDEIKKTFKAAIRTAAEASPADAEGDSVMQDFLANIFK